MSGLRIRPHHGLCVSFFEGKGYSDKFSSHMWKISKMMEEENPEITLVLDYDEICTECPNISKKRCGKALCYDKRVLNFCEISAGESLNWLDFRKTVWERIVLKGRLFEVCGDCEWYYICSKKQDESRE